MLFELIFRTILSEVQHCERGSIDWPVEVVSALAKCSTVELTQLATVLGVISAELDEILENSVAEQQTGR